MAVSLVAVVDITYVHPVTVGNFSMAFMPAVLPYTFIHTAIEVKLSITVFAAIQPFTFVRASSRILLRSLLPFPCVRFAVGIG